MKKKGSYKRFKNFSKLLFNINFGQIHNLRNSRTFDKKESQKNLKQNSYSNLIDPEIEYVSKLSFYNHDITKENKYNLRTMPNFKNPTLNHENINNNIRTFIEEHKLKSNKDKFTNQIKEIKLENKRKDLEIKINKIKAYIKSLNEELANKISEIENLKLDFDALQNNKIIIEKNFKKQIIANKLINKSRRSSLPFLSNKTLDIERNNQIKLKIDSVLLQHKEDMKSKKNYTILKINQLNEQKKEIVEKIRICEEELKDFKEERNKIKRELLIHYHNLLLEGKDTRKEGLSWIIRAIWNLKSNVLLSYLPKFLDDESISFLFSYSMKKMKMNSIYKIFHELSYKAKNLEENINTNHEKRSISKEKTIDDESNTIDTNIFDYNGYNISKENIENEEKKGDKLNINFSRNKDWLKEAAKTNSFIFKDNNKINLFNRPKEIIFEINQKNKNNKFLYTRNDTFRTSLFNNTNNTDIYLRQKEPSEFQELKKKNFFEYLNEIDENKIKNCIFNKKMLKGNCLFNKENKIKLTDFENIYNNKNNYEECNKELIELYNTRKEIEKKYNQLKNDIEIMIKNELKRLNKCFYKEDYESKYNIDQNSVISAIIGEENSKKEIIRQINENKKYFNTLKELRRGKIDH
jgi:hypothetical protein